MVMARDPDRRLDVGRRERSRRTTTMTTLSAVAGALSVQTFSTSGEGCLGYLLVEERSRVALAIDPRLDQVDQFAAALAAADARLVYVADTHTHADHLSGARRLAERTGAVRLAHAASPLTGSARRVSGGSTVRLGGLDVAVL